MASSRRTEFTVPRVWVYRKENKDMENKDEILKEYIAM